eukprot:6195710-Pleurochrysis_carterae.AAC.3
MNNKKRSFSKGNKKLPLNSQHPTNHYPITKPYWETYNLTKFWSRVFLITRGRKGILKINKISDWNNPPPKNTSTPPYTQEIAEEAANYYEHLYSPQIENNRTNNAKHRLLRN